MLIATGVSYRRHEAPGLDCSRRTRRLLRRHARAKREPCEGEDVYIVGAANSAGQAALNIARYARPRRRPRPRRVARGGHVVVPRRAHHVRPTTSTSASRPRWSTAAATGIWSGSRSPTAPPARPSRSRRTGCSSSSAPRRAPTGSAMRSPATSAASSSPATTCWRARAVPRWPLTRSPFVLETSVPGVFAAGDVRLDSMKRVASAVGEGAMSVYFVHRYLATI